MSSDSKAELVKGRIRGMFRYLVLYALREGPAHGYAIMKKISEIVGMDYVPSSGVLYPTLHALEREGFVKSFMDGRRRVYELTDKGRAELEAKIGEIERFVRSVKKVHAIAKRMGLSRIMRLAAFIVEHDIEVPPQIIEEIERRVKEIEALLKQAISAAGYKPPSEVE